MLSVEKILLTIFLSVLLQVQPLYPRVIELIARKTETLRVEQPNLKVMSWEDLKMIILNEVNKLLSDRQLSFILRCLTNAGVVSIELSEL